MSHHLMPGCTKQVMGGENLNQMNRSKEFKNFAQEKKKAPFNSLKIVELSGIPLPFEDGFIGMPE